MRTRNNSCKFKLVICSFIILSSSCSPKPEKSVEYALLDGDWSRVLKLVLKEEKLNDKPVFRRIASHACDATNSSDIVFSRIESLSSENIESYVQWTDSLYFLNPDNPMAIFLSADAKLQKRQFDSAIELLTNAIRLDSSFVLAYTLRAEACWEKGEIEKTLENCNQAIKIKPNYIGALLQRCIVNIELNNYNNAIIDCDKVIELDSLNITAFNNRAIANLVSKRKIDIALQDFNRALRINPQDRQTHLNKAGAFVENGYNYEAINTLYDYADIVAERDSNEYNDILEYINKIEFRIPQSERNLQLSSLINEFSDITYSFEDLNVKGSTTSPAGEWMDDIENGELFVSGVFVSEIDSIKREAIFGTTQFIYKDSSKTEIIGWGGCLISGEVICDTDIFSSSANGYVESSFEVESINSKHMLIKLDPALNHCLFVKFDISNNKISLFEEYYGAQVRVKNKIFTRETNGWYLNNKFIGNISTNAQEIVKEKAYQVRVQPGWTRSQSLPQGIDVGFTKIMAEGDYATFYFHYEVMPPEAGEPPSNTSDIKHQLDIMVRNKYPSARSISGKVPKVSGKILFNGNYEFNDNGKKVRCRYTYFLTGGTAFVVQCTAPSIRWETALTDFDAMLSSLQSGGSITERETKSDEIVVAELKRDIPTLIGSFPPQWKCSVSDVIITSSSRKDKRTLIIALSFFRTDITEIYSATKTVFNMMKAGSEMDRLSPQILKSENNIGEFVKYVGQVWGAAWGYVANCTPSIEYYTLPILDSRGKKIGTISISREDGAAILNGDITESDAERVAGMYVFD